MKIVYFKLLLLLCFISGCYVSGNVYNHVSPDIRNIYDSTVSILDCKKKPIGAGTIISNKKDGYIVVITAAHVVEDNYKNKSNVVILYGSKQYRNMIIVKYNKKYDLALLKSTTKELQSGAYVDLSKTGGYIGQKVWVIGSPSGAHRTVTFGVISNRFYKDGMLVYRTNAESFYGNSGGGVFSEDGELVAIINKTKIIFLNPLCLILEPGANFAVPIEIIKKFL